MCYTEHKKLPRKRMACRNPVTRGLCLREEEFCLEKVTTRDRLRDGLAIMGAHRRMRAINGRRGKRSSQARVT